MHSATIILDFALAKEHAPYSMCTLCIHYYGIVIKIVKICMNVLILVKV